MDLNGGTLNLEGLAILQKLEAGGKKNARGGIIPCSADIKRTAITIHRYANIIYPYEIGRIDGYEGEAVRFDVQRTIELAVKACGIEEEAATSSITVSHAVDAARFSPELIHMTAGAVVSHRGALDPITKRPMVGFGMQSRNNVFVYLSMLERETKQISEEIFQPMYLEFEKACKEGLPSARGWQPLRPCVHSDMSGQWKFLLRGGAMGVNK